MKLCVVMPAHWSGRLGGAEIQVRFLMRHLRQTTNHDISVICRHASMSVDEGVPIHRIRTAWPLARYTYLPDYPSVQRLLERYNPDLIYTRVGSPLVGFAARYCRRYGKAHVHHIARLDDVLPSSEVPLRNMLQRVDRRIYESGLRSADVVIAQAEYQAAMLRQHFGRHETQIIANYHPAPESVQVKDKRERLVIWVANIKAAKRPEAFVELAERCRALPNTHFMMVGAMSDASFAPMIEKARNFGNFTYAGPMPLEEVNRLMNVAHLVVNTSTALGEGFPNTFIQAWLRGVPVVSLEVNPDSLLDDGRLGICSSNSTDRLAHDVNSLLRDVGRLMQMGETARSHAVNAYGVGNLERIRKVLEQRFASTGN